jgi:hypothetical protein
MLRTFERSRPECWVWKDGGQRQTSIRVAGFDSKTMEGVNLVVDKEWIERHRCGC